MNNFSVCLESETLVDVLSASVQCFGEKIAYSSPGFSISYRAVEVYSSQFSDFLINDLRMNKGDRVAIQLPNLVHYPIVVFGALKAGMVIVNTNPLFTASEVIHQFNDAGVSTLVVLDELLSLHDSIREKVSVKNIISVSPSHLDRPINVSEEVFNFSSIFSNGRGTRGGGNVSIDPSDIAFLQYTEGTNKVSRGVMLTHGNVVENAKQTLDNVFSVLNNEGEVMVIPLPMYHIYPCAMATIIMPLIGAHSILIQSPGDLDSLVDQLKPFTMTCFTGDSLLFVTLCRHRKFRMLDFSKLKLTLSGFGSLATYAENLWLEITEDRICEVYGMTEASPIISCSDVSNPKPGSIGSPIMDTEIRLVDENYKDVSKGLPGELLVRGPQVMKGYWNKREETKKMITEEGWLKSGDIVIESNDGTLKFIGRKLGLID